MRPFFFIPATKIHKIGSLEFSGVEEIIIDFEDAVLSKDRACLMHEVIRISEFSSFWFRVPVRNDFSDEKKDFQLLKSFLLEGVKKIILPKIISKQDYLEIRNLFYGYKDLEIILLIEHPRLLLEMHQILQEPDLEKEIVGLGLGSHDLMTVLGGMHSSQNIYYPRLQILYLAKAYEKFAIDIASMNISMKSEFEEELTIGDDLGFENKFIIHPKQLSWLRDYSGVRKDLLDWAKRIVSSLPLEVKGKEIEPFILDGEIIEKPHVEKALTIIKKYRNEK